MSLAGVMVRRMLTLYRRHRPYCTFFGKSRHVRGGRTCGARCPIWVQGTLRGDPVRKSLDLDSWEAATDLVRSWEASGEIGRARPTVPSLADAVDKFIGDASARNLNAESIKKMSDAVRRLF